MGFRLAITAVVLAIVLTGAVSAEASSLGVFFSDTEFTDAATNVDPGVDPFDLYIVVLNSAYATVGGYECSFEFVGEQPTILSVVGPAGSGFENFGDDQNHLVTFTQAPVVVGGAAVLAIVTLQVASPSLVDVVLDVSDPTTIPGWLMIANGTDPDDLTACGVSSGDEVPDVVATINGSGITPVEPRPLSAIRSLFD